MATLEEATRIAGPAFEKRATLFVFDDIWPVIDIPDNIVAELVKLAKHEHSTIVYTTRDQNMIQDFSRETIIYFNYRNNFESEQILLKKSGLPKPSSFPHREAFADILQNCNGHPLALSLVGSIVNRLSKTNFIDDKDAAWSEIDVERETRNSDQVVKQIVMKTIKALSHDWRFSERSDKYIKYYSFFKSLCILRRSEKISLPTLQRLWWLPEAECERIIKRFNRFSLVRIQQDRKPCGGLLISLDDLILDICRSEAKRDGSYNFFHQKIISSYDPNINFSDVERGVKITTENVQKSMVDFRNWWLEHSTTEQFIFTNICHFLRESGRSEDVIWLVNQPQWIVSQLQITGMH